MGHDIVGRGAVADGHYPVKLRAGAHHRLLGEVVVAVRLGKYRVGVGIQLLQPHGAFAGQGVALPQKHPGADVHQRLERQVLLPQDTADEMLCHVRHEDDAEGAAPRRHLVDDRRHLHLLEAHLDMRLVQQVQELHECLGAEGIAL